MSVKIRDLQIGDDILVIIEREVNIIKALGALELTEIAKLERLAKTYVGIMSSTRENLKHGLFGKISAQEIDSLVEGAEESGESEDDAADPL